MAKTPKAPETPKYDYTSFKISNAKLRKTKDKETNEDVWTLNTRVPEDVSPTGWANITLPAGKLASDPEGKKSNWFKKDEPAVEGQNAKSTIYIANGIELTGTIAGKKGADPKVDELIGKSTLKPVTALEVRNAVIDNAKAYQQQNQGKTREIPEVGTEAEAQNEAQMS